jgi:hypothetical protein
MYTRRTLLCAAVAIHPRRLIRASSVRPVSRTTATMNLPAFTFPTATPPFMNRSERKFRAHSRTVH